MKKITVLFMVLFAFVVNDTFAQAPDNEKSAGLVYTEDNDGNVYRGQL